MEGPRVIGHIVAVQGFRVKVELLPETRSAVRASVDGLQLAVAINAYLTFSIGSGHSIIGIITDLEAREVFDPSTGDELTLELVKPRRTATVQLLGSVQQDDKAFTFSPGITILPTLETPAEMGTPEILSAVFEIPPKRNRPDGYDADDFDFDLQLGCPTGQPSNVVKASYNDLFSRPLAVVGNTGSGKSFSVSSIIQRGMAALDKSGNQPHIFIIDINGEYSAAFSGDAGSYERQPDRIYLNGKEFSIPLWLFNAAEICTWLRASEQTQEPVLKDWWAIAKANKTIPSVSESNSLSHAIDAVNRLIDTLASKGPKKRPAMLFFTIMKKYLGDFKPDGYDDLEAELKKLGDPKELVKDFEPLINEPEVRIACERIIVSIRAKITGEVTLAKLTAATADSPKYVEISRLHDPAMIRSAASEEDAARLDAHLTTLKLRLKSRLDDPRWHGFLNYDLPDTKFRNLSGWLSSFGIGETKGPRVSVLDLSMLSHEVLPYACTVLGRILLEARENLPAMRRYKHPWVLVLEEAHNYARPPRADEERGQVMSRLAFERIAKEGRKFGLSLIVASQRPSEISQTIISQCANFISHRLQNPDDIDHFKRIIPIQARRLLDQVTILASGEAIVFGSAFHIPTRVQISRPSPSPHSQTAAPYYEWKTEKEAFPLKEVETSWGVEEIEKATKNPSSDFKEVLP